MTEQDEVATRVIIADDQRLMRDGLASLLSVQPGIALLGTASNGHEAVALAVKLRPDVVLMDVQMPLMDGVAATAQIRQQVPACQVVMLTTFADDAYVTAALRVGAIGYLLKDVPADDLAQAIKTAHAGIFQLDATVARKALALRTEQKNESPPLLTHDLTEREIEVVSLIAQGASNREIAERLVISEGTVKNHISNILSRLGVRDRTQAALFAKEHGLLLPPRLG